MNSIHCSKLSFIECSSDTEWEKAKYFRQHYFFDKANLKDPYTWTFNHKDHKHFVLYLDAIIIGYAHIQLWPENRAAMRIIVIDESARNKKYGSIFLSFIERHLKGQGYKSLHAEAHPAALKFYKKNRYEEMPFKDPDHYPDDPADTPVGKLL